MSAIVSAIVSAMSFPMWERELKFAEDALIIMDCRLFYYNGDGD